MAVTDSSHRLKSWLDELGFKRGNPFELSEASKERDLLPVYYTAVSGYDAAINSPKSGIFTAPRGGGKTALRIMAATNNAPMSPVGETFVVEYTQFDSILENFNRDQHFFLIDHQRQLINACAHALCSLFCGTNQDDEATSIQRRELAITVSQKQNIRLATFLKIYAPELFDPLKLLAMFTKLVGDFEIDDWGSFTHAIKKEYLTEWIADIDSLRDHPTISFFAQIVDQTPQISQMKHTIIDCMAEFVQIVKQIGFANVIILIDGIDEYNQTTNDLEMQAQLIEPLVSHLPLMEMQDVAFKFFIPDNTYGTLKKREKLRLDRGFHNTTVQVAWDENNLRELLQRRLAVYSSGRVFDLAQICQGSSHISRYIEAGLISAAQNSPRRLLIAGDYLFNAHVNRHDAGPFLETADWDIAYKNLKQNGLILEAAESLPARSLGASKLNEVSSSVLQLRILSTEHRIYTGVKEIKTTPAEFRILESLGRNAGRLHRDKLAAQVWGTETGVSEAAIDRAISRLRKKLGDDKDDPKYIETERGYGFRLLNYKYEDQAPPKI